MKCAITSALLLVVWVAMCACVWAEAARPSGVQFLDEEVGVDFDLVGQVRFTSVAELDARVLFNLQPEGGQHYALALTGGTAKFYHVNGGNATHIGTVGTLTRPTDGSEVVPFALQRRDWRMALIWGDAVIARAYDSRLQEGKTGTLAISGCSFEELMIQPVGDIFLADDFVREEGATGGWEAISGQWQQRSLRDDEQAGRQEADKSANAFSYMGRRRGEGPAISVNGYWFWDLYSFEAAVQPGDDHGVGLVLHFQDADNYLAVRWLGRNHADGGRLQLVAVRRGETESVAEAPGGFQVGQWYNLRAAVADGGIRVWVDDELRLEGHTDLFGHGQIGLYCESRTPTFFDDAVCGPWELFAEDFAEQVPGKWHTLHGKWQFVDGVLSSTSTDTALIVTGRTAWDSYQYSVNVQPTGGGAGLVVGYRDPENYYLLRWAANSTDYAGKAQVVQFADGQPEVLAEAPVNIPARASQRAEATLRRGVLSLSIEARKQVEAFVPEVTGGAVGLYSSGAAGTQFDHALLQIISPPRSSRIVAEFADVSSHPEMAEWASTRAPWLPLGEGGTVWWTKGDYFGEHALVFTVADIGNRTGKLELFIGASSPDDPAARKLTVELKSGSREMALMVERGGQRLAEAQVPVEGSEAELSFQRRGHWLVVLVNGEPALQADATSSPQATD